MELKTANPSNSEMVAAPSIICKYCQSPHEDRPTAHNRIKVNSIPALSHQRKVRGSGGNRRSPAPMASAHNPLRRIDVLGHF